MTEATKGYDDSPPRNGVIAFYTVLAIAVLIGTNFLLDSYFARMMNAEIHEKVLVRGLDLAIETKANEQAALEKAGIGNAMRTLAQGRGASPLIAPESGASKTAITGWTQLKREVPEIKPPAPKAAPEPAPEAAPATGAAVSPGTKPSAVKAVAAPGAKPAVRPAPAKNAPAKAAPTTLPAPAGAAR